MTTEITTTASIVPTSGDNFELSAQNPEEMVQCHHAAIEWAKRKIEAMQSEADVIGGEVAELSEAYEHAKERKWKSGTLGKHAELAKKRQAMAMQRKVFYQKMLAAFEAGYYIVPNFPVTLFAIRTDKPSPKRMWARLRYSTQQNFEQEAKILPAGDGHYQNPQPLVKQVSGPFSEQDGSKTYGYEATSWQDLDFPANMARIHVMEATTRAMDAKIFDEVGFLPQDYKRNPDPLLIGRLIDPRPVGYGETRKVSFIIAWHINTATL